MSQVDDLAEFVEQSADYDWLDKAACGDLPLEQLELFFVDAGRTLSKEAMDLCNRCEARDECLQHSISRGITGGYFGGMSPTKRRKIDVTPVAV